MTDEVLKGYIIESLNEIKKIALSIEDERADIIIEECDLTIGEIMK